MENKAKRTTPLRFLLKRSIFLSVFSFMVYFFTLTFYGLSLIPDEA